MDQKTAIRKLIFATGLTRPGIVEAVRAIPAGKTQRPTKDEAARLAALQKLNKSSKSNVRQLVKGIRELPSPPKSNARATGGEGKLSPAATLTLLKSLPKTARAPAPIRAREAAIGELRRTRLQKGAATRKALEQAAFAKARRVLKGQKDLADVVQRIATKRKLSGLALLRFLGGLPRKGGRKSKVGFDDTRDSGFLPAMLPAAMRTSLGINAPAKSKKKSSAATTVPKLETVGKAATADVLKKTPMPKGTIGKAAAPQPPGGIMLLKGKFNLDPTYVIRLHVVLCTNDDGSGYANAALAPAYIEDVVDEMNAIYEDAALEFAFYPAADFEVRQSTLLNQDFTPPAGLDLSVGIDTPPLNDTQLANAAKPHDKARKDLADQHPNKLVVFMCDGTGLAWDAVAAAWTITPRWGGFSGGDTGYFVTVADVGGGTTAEAINGARLWAHELGHYLHLSHTFGGNQIGPVGSEALLPASDIANILVGRAAELIRAFVDDQGNPKDNGLNALDGDGVIDTPPDISNEIFQYVNGKDCDGPDTVDIPVTLKDEPRTYVLAPDRGNVMSYFKHCMNQDAHFSLGQALIMRDALENKNRTGLINTQLGVTSVPGLSYHGIWNPSAAGQFVSWGTTLDDHKARYGEMWDKDLTLIHQQAHLINGQIRYDGIWNPNPGSQFVVWAVTFEELQALYDEWWINGFRLIHQQAYVVGGQLLFDAIWDPGNHGQFVTWTQTPETFQTLYDECWNEGFRLLHQQRVVVNGQVLYNGIWNFDSSSQFVTWGYAAADHATVYAEMWDKGFRLAHQQAYVEGGSLFFDAIWNPGNDGQFVSWSKTREQLMGQYDELWNEGFKLIGMCNNPD